MLDCINIANKRTYCVGYELVLFFSLWTGPVALCCTCTPDFHALLSSPPLSHNFPSTPALQNEWWKIYYIIFLFPLLPGGIRRRRFNRAFVTFPQGSIEDWSIAEKINALHALYYSLKPWKVNVEGHHCVLYNIKHACHCQGLRPFQWNYNGCHTVTYKKMSKTQRP